jgi:hypothetical protein
VDSEPEYEHGKPTKNSEMIKEYPDITAASLAKFKRHTLFYPRVTSKESADKYPPMSWQTFSRRYPDLYYGIVGEIVKAGERNCIRFLAVTTHSAK